MSWFGGFLRSWAPPLSVLFWENYSVRKLSCFGSLGAVGEEKLQTTFFLFLRGNFFFRPLRYRADGRGPRVELLLRRAAVPGRRHREEPLRRLEDHPAAQAAAAAAAAATSSEKRDRN